MISTNGITTNFIARSKIVVIIIQVKYPTGGNRGDRVFYKTSKKSWRGSLRSWGQNVEKSSSYVEYIPLTLWFYQAWVWGHGPCWPVVFSRSCQRCTGFMQHDGTFGATVEEWRGKPTSKLGYLVRKFPDYWSSVRHKGETGLNFFLRFGLTDKV